MRYKKIRFEVAECNVKHERTGEYSNKRWNSFITVQDYKLSESGLRIFFFSEIQREV